MAWTRDLLCPRGDGAEHAARADRRHHAASHGCLHAAMRSTVDRSNRWVLLGKRYLIHDRDTKYTQAFDALLKDSGVKPVLLPPRSPNLNAHCERFVRSIKEEALERMVILGERALYYAIRQYLSHYHTERNHQGLSNQLIAPEGAVGRQTGPVTRRKRLGGLLSYYHREAA